MSLFATFCPAHDSTHYTCFFTLCPHSIMLSGMAWVSAKLAQAVAAVSPAKTIHVPDHILIDCTPTSRCTAHTSMGMTSSIRCQQAQLEITMILFGSEESCKVRGGGEVMDSAMENMVQLTSSRQTMSTGTGLMSKPMPPMWFSPKGPWQEAVDILHWSYTDWLLTHPQPIQLPFSQEECQEPLRLLNDPSQQSTLSYTCMVTCILLHAICIILSASVTLISFLGLDGITHIGGLVAISCSILSMYKAELLQGSAAVHHAAAAHEGFIFLLKESKKKAPESYSLVNLYCININPQNAWLITYQKGLRRIKGGLQRFTTILPAYDAFNSDAKDGGPEDFNPDEGTNNTDLEDLDSDAEQHRQLTHVPRPQADVAELLFPAAPNPNTDQCNPAWWKSQDGKLKGTLTELYEMIPADLHESMVTYKQFGSMFVQVHGQERSNVLKVIKDCAGMLFTPYNISPESLYWKACLVPVLVKVICVLMFGKSILAENKCGWPPARGQKMGMLSVTEGLIAGACILVRVSMVTVLVHADINIIPRSTTDQNMISTSRSFSKHLLGLKSSGRGLNWQMLNLRYL
ncbi:hypothetical protein F5J12DRAFT_786628 [Pisolithus orientalis]|uniref:uncharacterized protein n=1 Tax=Pisolithus orientalis TaxID=936130 RepID=UPI0022256861|nr:uncharacterized protein F5J12DRAFT_786628 [Pisolithus orientalis]KAI5989829.1 hypothetical protein F5J12DRAFT_786628 [Pisolithus orientalis]